VVQRTSVRAGAQIAPAFRTAIKNEWRTRNFYHPAILAPRHDSELVLDLINKTFHSVSQVKTEFNYNLDLTYKNDARRRSHVHLINARRDTHNHRVMALVTVNRRLKGLARFSIANQINIDRVRFQIPASGKLGSSPSNGARRNSSRCPVPEARELDWNLSWYFGWVRSAVIFMPVALFAAILLLHT
jgi:hypothetical protein